MSRGHGEGAWGPLETKSAAPVALGAHPGAIRGIGLKSSTSGPPEILSIYTLLVRVRVCVYARVASKTR